MLHLLLQEMAWLHRRRVWVLNWRACTPDLTPNENIKNITKRKIWERRQRTVELLESHIKQACDNIPLSKVQQLDSSVPRCLQTVATNTQWYSWPCPTFYFWDVLLLSISKWAHIFPPVVRFLESNIWCVFCLWLRIKYRFMIFAYHWSFSRIGVVLRRSESAWIKTLTH